VRLLLDTHIALWLVRDARELTAAARRLIDDAEAVHVSSVSIWEAVIKAALGKLPLDPARLEAQLRADGVEPLTVTWAHARAVHALPMLHRDPFDRMLIAQALSEPLHLLTHDTTLAAYSADLVLVV
jgi:PIN domain nuclease of toxin-antitoxin system